MPSGDHPMHFGEPQHITWWPERALVVRTLAVRCKADEHSFAAATTRNALEAGYRHLDCAPVYGNEALVGEAIQPWLKEHGRDSLFLTSKVWNDAHRPQLLRCVRMSTWLLCATGVLCAHKMRQMRLVPVAGAELPPHPGDEGDAMARHIPVCRSSA